MIIDDMKKDLIKFIKERPFVFCGLIIYLGGLAIYCFCFADSNQLTLNEVGDFLAGAFSPLAFLFLYLGYKQQGEEMGRNTAALEKQELALTKSVEAQNRLIELQEQEQTEKHLQVYPNFIVDDIKKRRYKVLSPDYDDNGNMIDQSEEEFIDLSFTLFNTGEIAKNILLKNVGQGIYVNVNRHKVSSEEKLKVNISLDGHDIYRLEKGEYFCGELKLIYNNLYGKVYEKKLVYDIGPYSDQEEVGSDIYFNVSIENRF